MAMHLSCIVHVPYGSKRLTIKHAELSGAGHAGVPDGGGGDISSAWRGRQHLSHMMSTCSLSAAATAAAMAVVMTLTASLIASLRNAILHHNNRLVSPNIALIDS